MEENVYHILEFDEIRKKLAACAPSELSKEMALQLTPYTMKELVAEKLNETEEAVRLLTDEIQTPLGETHRLAPILDKVEKESLPTAGEFQELATTLETHAAMHAYFQGERHLKYPIMEELASLIVPLDALTKRIRNVFDPYGEVSDNASPRLLRIRRSMATMKARIRRSFKRILEDRETAAWLQDAIITQRNGRYVVPVKEAYRYKFEGIVHDRSSTGQTLFMEPVISISLNNDLAELRAEEAQEIHEIFAALGRAVLEYADSIRGNGRNATDIEFILAKGRLALSMHGSRAVLSSDKEMYLKEVRHPLIPPERAVPISIGLGKSYQVLVISGSNAGGKTIALKTAGLAALMNQSGLFIPADEGSRLPVYTAVHAIIGDEQSIQYDLSTFSSYVTQLAALIDNAGHTDLVLLDELGTGTDPIEGAALAEAVTEHLRNHGVSSIITSHFSEMKKLAYEAEGIENAFVEFDEITMQPTYRLITGVAGNSNAFTICRRCGLNGDIINRGEALKNKSALHQMDVVMERLNSQMVAAEKERRDLQEQLRAIAAEKNKIKSSYRELYEKKDRILEKARLEAETIKRELRARSETIIKELKKAQAKDGSHLARDIANARSAIDHIHVPDGKIRRRPLALTELREGLYVYIRALDTDGQIQSISGKNVMVNTGLHTVNVKVDQCYETAQPTMKKEKPSIQVSTRQAISHGQVQTELNIIGKHVDEALPEVDRFLNHCLLAGISPVRIIHGKGTGRLRKGIHEHLKTLPYVTEFHEADVRSGGAGATEVYF
ncbi:MAG: endonuclease MutS2 [Dialister sp.]|nr:endonuclease MutS2 [Dialister sp.]